MSCCLFWKFASGVYCWCPEAKIPSFHMLAVNLLCKVLHRLARRMTLVAMVLVGPSKIPSPTGGTIEFHPAQESALMYDDICIFFMKCETWAPTMFWCLYCLVYQVGLRLWHQQIAQCLSSVLQEQRLIVRTHHWFVEMFLYFLKCDWLFPFFRWCRAVQVS